MKASNPSYMDILAEEPHVPIKTVADETTGVEKTVPKTRADMTVKRKGSRWLGYNSPINYHRFPG